jgi:hypothetical protein
VAPIPLILKLIDKLLRARFLPNSMYDGDTTTLEFVKATSGKLLSKLQ